MRECQAEGCRTAARYNHPRQAVGAFCNVHREEGMRNVMHKPCAAEGCFMQATAVQMKTLLHVSDKRTVTFFLCCLQAVFNTQGQTRGLYCSKHKQEGMVGPGLLAMYNLLVCQAAEASKPFTPDTRL